MPWVGVASAGGGICANQYKSCQEKGVDTVHTMGFGPGRTSEGSGRIPYVSAGSQCLQGLEGSSSPTSGTQTPSSEGLFALSVCTKLWPNDSDDWFAGFGLAVAVAYSGVWVTGSVP